MGSEITTRNTVERPAIPSQAQSTALSVFLNRVFEIDFGHPRLDRSLAPSPSERDALSARRRELADGLRACERLDAAEAVLKMFDAWPNAKMDAAKAKGIAVTYTELLTPFPIWAIRLAIKEAQRQASPFPPSAGALRALCEEQVRPFEEERNKIGRVLAAELIEVCREKAEEAKQRVRAAADSLSRSVVPPRRGHDYRESPKEAAERRLESLEYTESPVEVSAELRRRFQESRT